MAGRALTVFIQLLHFLQLPFSSSQQDLYPTCYACGCPTCEVGDFEGRIPIPEPLRVQIGGFSEISCFQISQAGLAGLIPPDICNLNKGRDFQQACQCPPLPPTVAPTHQPTVSTTPTLVPSVVAFDEGLSIEPTSMTAVPSPATRIPVPMLSMRPSNDKGASQNPSNQPPSGQKDSSTLQPIVATEFPIFTPIPTAGNTAMSQKKSSEKKSSEKKNSEELEEHGREYTSEKSSSQKKSEKESAKSSEAEKSGKGSHKHPKGRRKRLHIKNSGEHNKHQKLKKKGWLRQEESAYR